jgi:hypothetical protein
MHTALKSLFAVAATVASIAASAQPFAYTRIDMSEIDARQARQETRIERGLARGELTRREARTLQQGQREIARAEARAKADGHVSRHELRRLTALLDHADAQIRQLRHDRDGRRSS